MSNEVELLVPRHLLALFALADFSTRLFFLSSSRGSRNRRSNDRSRTSPRSGTPSIPTRFPSEPQPSTTDPRLRSTSTAVSDAAAAVPKPTLSSDPQSTHAIPSSSPLQSHLGSSTAAVPTPRVDQPSTRSLPQPTSHSSVPNQPKHLPPSHPSLFDPSASPNRRKH